MVAVASWTRSLERKKGFCSPAAAAPANRVWKARHSGNRLASPWGTGCFSDGSELLGATGPTVLPALPALLDEPAAALNPDPSAATADDCPKLP